MEHGNRFHAAGPATTNTSAELCPRPLNYKVAASRRPSSTLCRAQINKYAGASPCIALYIIRHSLNWMHCATGSQCSRSRIKPMTCEYFSAPQSILIAAFITHCRRSRTYFDNPARRLLLQSVLLITKLLTKEN